MKQWAWWLCITADNKEAFPKQRYHSAVGQDFATWKVSGGYEHILYMCVHIPPYS